jgi:hypothetical protein
MAEGLDRARIADLRAGLSDGARAAFLDARLSAAERQMVVTVLSLDPGERAEISSAADLLDCVGTDPIPLPPGLLAKAAAAFVAENSVAGHGVAMPGRRTWRRQALLIVGVGLAAFVLVMTAVAGLLSAGTLAPSAEPVSSVRPTAGKAADRATPAPGLAALDASYRPQVPPADNLSTKPHADGPNLRITFSRHSGAFGLERPSTILPGSRRACSRSQAEQYCSSASSVRTLLIHDAQVSKL